MQQVTFRAMGSQILAMLDDDGAAAARALARVSGWFAAWEQHLSRFRPDSELSVLNRDGYLREASPVLWTVVRLALNLARQTGGLVTPTLLDALEAAGYDGSFETLQPQTRVPPVANMRRLQSRLATGASAWRQVHCDPATRSIRLLDNVRLDLGGSAKGWAVDTTVHRLTAYGPALADAGGDIAISGPQSDGSAWPIAVADPSSPGQELDIVLLTHGGIATSGRDYRRWQRNGSWQHHLIDPRTMQPATTDVLSATVAGPNAVQCEGAAKVVLLLGSRDGLAWLEAQPRFAGLVTLEDGIALRSSRFDACRWQAPASGGIVA